MKAAHRKLKHFLISMMLDREYWAHVYLMCDKNFDTQHAVSKMLDLLEGNGVNIRIPMVMITELEIMTAGRIREIALANSTPDQVEALDKTRELAFCLWVSGDKAINAELEMVH